MKQIVLHYGGLQKSFRSCFYQTELFTDQLANVNVLSGLDYGRYGTVIRARCLQRQVVHDARRSRRCEGRDRDGTGKLVDGRAAAHGTGKVQAAD